MPPGSRTAGPAYPEQHDTPLQLIIPILHNFIDIHMIYSFIQFEIIAVSTIIRYIQKVPIIWRCSSQ